MQVLGKILGAFFGFLLGGPIGLLLGIFLGHKFDQARRNANQDGGFGRFSGGQTDHQSRQAEFFHAGFSVMGHMAKAKGRVTQEEIRVASAIMDRMQLHGEARRLAQDAFREGKAEDFPLQDVLGRVRHSTQGRLDLLQFFLELQIQAAFADGSLHPKERQLLFVIGRGLGFSDQQLERRLHMQEAAFRFQQGGGFYRQQSQQQGGPRQAPRRDQLADAYELLGVAQDASAKDLKRSYRKLMNEHHPDKLAAKGLPPEMMELAKQKAQELTAAYELIKKEKGYK
ncbi:co-chaperone DjlA [Photobacterium sp. 1_MG-2023]|uniref:co-chaperone DjlA n=1 Tax=Photobacterium sp. 1_MG-2023 TaxID=3062646 RepID=UPI0026E26549|nr:co-chaperone DjlA [Photobacterium sp. 1_MG-2023]MDO6707636.1 co-chaperone DjlA [Photobacterium sp. 1_MG-2023]